ncbi:unnamed protein product [Adineta ricciae]|uniref:Apple domain-containing protein n=1 Tax=Adineta ricciae TaxID=249248 RepID=A0A815Y5N1_ADIRI|nr:unnamed protein product [Adineta ricciae]CAF1565945.1 unnamed protein product [Adineta ricciae]
MKRIISEVYSGLFLFLVLISIPSNVENSLIDWQSSTNLSNVGFRFRPVNYQALILAEVTSKSLFTCVRTCHSTSGCRILDYDDQSKWCRLFEGNIATMGSIENSSSSQMRVGSRKFSPQQFINRGQSCSFCQGSRYLQCLNNTCQCQQNTYFDGTMCQSQKLLGAPCYNASECRQDLNYTCLARQQCGPASIQTATIVAGYNNGQSGSDSTGLSNPTGISLGIDSALYVSDYSNHRVMRYPEGSLLGSRVAGTGFSGSGTNQLYGPTGVHVDKSSNIYVADSMNYRIMLWKMNASTGVKVAGTGSVGNTLSSFGVIAGIFVDQQGYIYICDSSYHRVMRFSPNITNGIIIGGNGIAGSGNNQLNSPYGIYFDEVQSFVYVADSGNNRVQRFQVGGLMNGTTVAGGHGAGSANDQLNNPYSVCFSTTNNALYIADPGNQRIQFWYLGATNGLTIAGNGAMIGNSSTILTGSLDIRIDVNSTNLFVSEMNYNRVWRFPLL